MTWERARKPEQKAVRREEILSAAKSLFSELEYEEISLNAIAREAGFSKPNVYRYFSTREEIFLAIFRDEQDSFVTGLIERVSKIRSKDPVTRIAEIWVEQSLKHPTVLNLLPVLMTSMEKNSSVEQLTEFKKEGKTHFEELVVAFSKACPQLSSEQWAFVMQSITALMAGLWPMCNPADNVREAMKNAEVDDAWQYKTLMSQGIISLTNGTKTIKGTKS